MRTQWSTHNPIRPPKYTKNTCKQVRKEKLDPRAPSILVHFAPPVPTATCPRVTNLKVS